MNFRCNAALVLSLLVGGWVWATEFELSRSTIGGGSVVGMGGDFELAGTITQVGAAAAASGGDFDLTGGFWIAIVPGDCAEDGGLGLPDYSYVSDCLTGPGAPLAADSCACIDLDGDDDVDLKDVAAFQVSFTGG